MRRIIMIILLIGLSSLLAASRFVPKIDHIRVLGNQHYSEQDILNLANLSVGTPFFWITTHRLSKLRKDPWIAQVRVIRHWPNTIALSVVERKAVATNGVLSYALDGTVLPNLNEAEKNHLIKLEGWGKPRVEEALNLIYLLAEFEPKVLSYSPAGFFIELTNMRLFTPNAEVLTANWASFLSQQGAQVNLSVYPWGVSAAHD